ncbi:cell surface glycoprotein CD200 receptor 1-B-like [Rana temporaria]|uniref:cell surface glycoprotein CD200 receptor 1-B-like n=1 Tax=Rana temporaria TaxID=8407 RepID=UPI001AADDF31|nr:cell surface glycoprotein CD200 receptor 1-B-like [Rana temporaria]
MYLLAVLLLLYRDVSSIDVTVVGRRGNSTVLQCGGDPGDPITGVIWKIHHMNNSRCLFSYAPYNRGRQIYSNCSTRITFTNRTLTIHNTQISDGGNYTCEMSSLEGTFITTTILQVLAQPSVSLDINSDGSPECRAIGGFPAAEISWIPPSDDINTTEIKDLDDTWTVISTYKSDGDMVTCLVSHPTFVNLWSQSIASPPDTIGATHYFWRIVALVIFSCLVIGVFLYCRYKSKAIPM